MGVPIDFEEALSVRKVDEHTWEGVHPLNLPIAGARGTYGGHTFAQTLLVAMESAPGLVPHSVHSHFLRAGNAKVPCTYKVESLLDGDRFCRRQIKVVQNGKVSFIATISFVKKNTEKDQGKTPAKSTNYIHHVPALQKKYPDPSKLHQSHHTDFINNAYSDEFLDYSLAPEEQHIPPSERWITLWSKLHQPHKKQFTRSMFNYVGLADVSDAAILTTMARALHMDWNPTKNNADQDFDPARDARHLMSVSLNALHIFHYEAMSLDHNVYFHTDDFDSFDVLNDYLTLTYQYKISSSGRTLVRGHFFNKSGDCVATFVQEGLTFMRRGVPATSRM